MGMVTLVVYAVTEGCSFAVIIVHQHSISLAWSCRSDVSSPFWRLLWHPHGVVIVLPLLLEIVVACTPYVVIADFCYFLFRLFQKRTGSVPTAGVQYAVGRQ
jgi:hypothetical protein